MPSRLRTAVLVSGRGSNMASLIEAAKDPVYPAEIAVVLANLPEAGGIARAAEAGIPTAVVDHRPFGKDRAAFEQALDAALRAHGIELIALAGFMRVLTPWFVDRWQGRMVNIHPSLLPAYKGLHTHERALADGATVHGCTVHWVVSDLDAGPAIAQAQIPVLSGDTPETLAARVLAEEHRLYPAALAEAAREIMARQAATRQQGAVTASGD